MNVGGTTLSTLIVRRLVNPKINFQRVSRKIITLVDGTKKLSVFLSLGRFETVRIMTAEKSFLPNLV